MLTRRDFMAWSAAWALLGSGSLAGCAGTGEKGRTTMSNTILFNGRIASLPPVARSRKGGLRLIRPLAFATEDLTAAYARALGFPTIGCVCGDRDGVRREIRAFLAGLRERHAGIPESIGAALGNVNPYTLHLRAGLRPPSAGVDADRDAEDGDDANGRARHIRLDVAPASRGTRGRR